MIKTNIFLGNIVLCLVLLSACNDQKLPDVSEIKTNHTYFDFSKAFQKLDSQNHISNIKEWKKNYADFLSGFASYVMEDNIENDTAIAEFFLDKYKFEKGFQMMNDTVVKHRFDTEKIEKEAEAAFKYYQYYMEKDSSPNVFFYSSSFFSRNPYFGNSIGVSLEFYLGKNIPYYPIQFAKYQIRRFEPAYIVPDLIHALAFYDLEPVYNDRRFLDHMISEAKAMYVTKLALPKTQDSIIWGYTAEQMQWCADNEQQMWEHMVSPKINILYSTDFNSNIRYFEDAPFTNANQVPPESAPRFATWVGTKIIEKYMQNNPELSVKEMLFNKNADEILKGSKYKP